MNIQDESAEVFATTVSTTLKDNTANSACRSSIRTLTKTSKALTFADLVIATRSGHLTMEFATLSLTLRVKTKLVPVTAKLMSREDAAISAKKDFGT